MYKTKRIYQPNKGVHIHVAEISLYLKFIIMLQYLRMQTDSDCFGFFLFAGSNGRFRGKQVSKCGVSSVCLWTISRRVGQTRPLGHQSQSLLRQRQMDDSDSQALVRMQKDGKGLNSACFVECCRVRYTI